MASICPASHILNTLSSNTTALTLLILATMPFALKAQTHSCAEHSFDYGANANASSSPNGINNTPDAITIMNMIGGSTYLHSINSPDAGGDACDTRMGTILLPHWTFRTMPNFPNFRLGALRGSPCDTLGIEEGVTVATSPSPSQEGEHIRVFPNPTSGNTRIEWNENLQSTAKIEIINSVGQIIEIIKVENNITYKDIDTKNLPNGIYFIKLSTTENQTFTTKLIKISD